MQTHNAQQAVRHPSLNDKSNTLPGSKRSRLWAIALLALTWMLLAQPVMAEERLSIEPINVNEASVELLAELPGIGPGKAKAIVEDRQANGPFTTIEDLTRVKGIGDATVARLKDEISLR
ncbi:ComEA family DNA-binding protein [Halomonas sp. DN3]|uniref:ComEA family DNA-binding protein n=1 Tax=Halomonas sp. DN3 TaxID=2953657 RepID=UPI003460E51C